MSPISILGNSLHIMHIMQCITKTMLHYWSSFLILAQPNPSVSQEHSNHKNITNAIHSVVFFIQPFSFEIEASAETQTTFKSTFFKSYFFKTNLSSTPFGPFHFPTGLHLHLQYTLSLQNCCWFFFIGFSLDFHWKWLIISTFPKADVCCSSLLNCADHTSS